MELLQSLREHLISLVSANGEDQSVCTQIVDHLDDLQRLHEKLVRTAESDVGREDPKTIESKQKGILTMSTQKGSLATPREAAGPIASLISLKGYIPQ
ncbi:Hypothetical protein CINCED_3A014948 [Cinara cedri]|uniref:Uncharacterized protein n=1 Tax=Cinara cedri TaxID=506608 RepID=A0A5E4NDB1_9HEMI|nr:Hypothetical protein CINCED_3A014948 [Cinara cedri]